MDAVLERGPVADQVQPEPGPLPLGPHPWSGQPDLGDQVAAGQLGQHPGVDPIGLGRQRGQPLDLHRVGDLHLPAAQLELVVDEAGAGHRLDRRRHRLAKLPDPGDQRGQPAGVRRRGRHQHRRACLVHGVHIQTCPPQVQPNVQHEDRAPVFMAFSELSRHALVEIERAAQLLDSP